MGESFIYLAKQSSQPIQQEKLGQILAAIDRLLEGQDKKTIKQIYRSFINRITFDKEKKLMTVHLAFNEQVIDELNKYDDEELLPECNSSFMYFDQDTINQLNEFYREIILGKADVVSLFVYHGVLELEL